MKLHLPKLLLAALLACCSCAYAHNGWGTGTNNYCLDQEGGVTASIDASNREYIRFNADIATTTGCNMNATVSELKMKADSTIIIKESFWGGNRNFALLDIGSVSVANEGVVNIEVGSSNGASIGAVSGTVGRVTNAGNLTLGTADSNTQFSATISNTGALSVLGNLGITSDLRNFEAKSTQTVYSEGSNGYATISGSFYLAKGASLAQQSVAQAGNNAPVLLDTTTESGNTLFSSSYTTPEYWVNSGTVIIGGDAGEIANTTDIVLNGGIAALQANYNLSQVDYRSGSVNIGAGSTLTADADFSIPFITSLTGAGTLKITRDNTIQGGNQRDKNEATTTTQFQGNISVASGATLRLGDASEWMQNWSVDLDSLKSIDLDGGNLRFFGANSSLSTINVNSAGTITSWESGANGLSGLHIGKLLLNEKLNLNGGWNSVFDVDELSGTGALELTHDARGGSTFTLNIDSVDCEGSITTGSNTVLNIGTGDASTHHIGSTITVGGTLALQGSVNLAADVNQYRLHQNGEVTQWSETTDGYAYSSGSTYYLAYMDGGRVTNTADELKAINESLSLTENGDIIFAAGANWGSVYHLNTKDVTVGGSNGHAAADAASGFVVAKGRTLTVDGSTTTLSAADVLRTTTGEGNITMSSSAELQRGQRSLATGQLTITDSAQVTLRCSLDGNSASLESFSQVVLDKGTLLMSEGETSLQSLQTGAGGGLLRMQSTGSNGWLTISGTTTLNGKLTLDNVWTAKASLARVTGSGDLEMTSWGNAYGEIMNVTIGSMENYTGNVLFQSNRGDYAASLHIGSIGSMGTLTNFGASTIITIGDSAESVHNLSHTMSVQGKITMQGKINLGDDLSHFDLKELGTIVNWSDEQDGYAISTGSVLTLINLQDGATLGNTAEELAAMNAALRIDEEGDVVFTADEFQGTTYHLRTKNITVGGSSGYAAAVTARRMDVAEGRTLTIAGATDYLSMANLVVTTTGKGAIVLDARGDVTLDNHSVSVFEGSLTIAEGTRLMTGNHQDNTCNISSFSSIVLDGSELKIHSNNVTVNNLTVSQKGGILYAEDMRNEGRGSVRLAGETQLLGDMLLGNWYNAQYQFDKLTGTGNINLDPYHSSKLVVDVLSAADWKGQLNLDLNKGSLDKLDVVMPDDWAGVVNLSNAAEGGIRLDTLGDKATVNMTDNRLYLKTGSDSTADIDSALKLNGSTTVYDGAAGSTYNFNGQVSGIGSLEVASESGSGLNFNFRGDTKQWSGQVQLSGGAHNVTFTDGATTINNSQISATGMGTLNLGIENSADVVVNSILTHGSDAALHLMVNNTHNTVFTANVEASSITTNGSGRTEFRGAVSAESLSLNAATLFAGSVSGDVQANTTGSLVLGNSLLSITGSLTADVGAIDLSTFVLSMPLSDVELPQLLTFNLVETSGVMSISNISTADVGNLGLDYDSDHYKAYLTVMPQTQVGNLLVLNMEYIPEPATATLSLLALTGLAARRRRRS